MTLRHALLVAVALVVLVTAVAAMVLTSGGPVQQLGPYPTGDGDAVTVAPRSAP